MIEMRWLTRTLQPRGYGVPEMKETVLQYREAGGQVNCTPTYENGWSHSEIVWGEWQDVPNVEESPNA